MAGGPMREGMVEFKTGEIPMEAWTAVSMPVGAVRRIWIASSRPTGVRMEGMLEVRFSA